MIQYVAEYVYIYTYDMYIYMIFYVHIMLIIHVHLDMPWICLGPKLILKGVILKVKTQPMVSCRI